MSNPFEKLFDKNKTNKTEATTNIKQENKAPLMPTNTKKVNNSTMPAPSFEDLFQEETKQETVSDIPSWEQFLLGKFADVIKFDPKFPGVQLIELPGMNTNFSVNLDISKSRIYVINKTTNQPAGEFGYDQLVPKLFGVGALDAYKQEYDAISEPPFEATEQDLPENLQSNPVNPFASETEDDDEDQPKKRGRKPGTTKKDTAKEGLEKFENAMKGKGEVSDATFRPDSGQAEGRSNKTVYEEIGKAYASLQKLLASIEE